MPTCRCLWRKLTVDDNDNALIGINNDSMIKCNVGAELWRIYEMVVGDSIRKIERSAGKVCSQCMPTTNCIRNSRVRRVYSWRSAIILKLKGDNDNKESCPTIQYCSFKHVVISIIQSTSTSTNCAYSIYTFSHSHAHALVIHNVSTYNLHVCAQAQADICTHPSLLLLHNYLHTSNAFLSLAPPSI